LPALVARALAAWTAPRGRRVSLALLAGAAAYLLYAAQTKWNAAIQPHWRGFSERAWGKPPFWKNEDNLPLADLGAFKRIRKVLDEQHKRFAGYLISQFGMMMFTNAAFDVPDFGWSIWFNLGGLRSGEPDTCLFWDEGTSRDWLVWENGYFVLKEFRRSLILGGPRVCQHYHAHWDPEGDPRGLCHRCWDSRGRIVSE
jgi:hypothetical protein